MYIAITWNSTTILMKLWSRELTRALLAQVEAMLCNEAEGFSQDAGLAAPRGTTGEAFGCFHKLSSTSMGFSLVNHPIHPFGGTPIYGTPPFWVSNLKPQSPTSSLPLETAWKDLNISRFCRSIATENDPDWISDKRCTNKEQSNKNPRSRPCCQLWWSWKINVYQESTAAKKKHVLAPNSQHFSWVNSLLWPFP